MCGLNATLDIIEADGSMSDMALCTEPEEDSSAEFKKDNSPFEQIECVQACSDGGVVICDECNNLRKYSKDGEFVWKINMKVSDGTRFCIGINDWLYCPTEHQINVYLPNGVFSHVLVKDLECVKGIAVDDNNNVHIGASSASSSIQVFNPKGKLIHEYGHPKLTDATTIAISNGDPQLVVVTEFDAEKLFIFDIMGSFLYSVKGVGCICDMTFGPDNSLWIAEWEANHFGEIMLIPELFQLPPPLSYLCEVSVLPHLNELPVSRLPPRLARLFEKWIKLVTVAVKYSSFTDDRSKSRSVLETIKLKVEPNASDGMVLWLVCRRMHLKYSKFDIASHGSRSLKDWERVSFPSECASGDFFVYPRTLNDSSDEQSDDDADEQSDDDADEQSDDDDDDADEQSDDDSDEQSDDDSDEQSDNDSDEQSDDEQSDDDSDEQ